MHDPISSEILDQPNQPIGGHMDLMAWFDAKIVEMQEAKAQYEADLKLKYDEGYGAGKASVVLPDAEATDLLYTQADMDRLAAVAKEEKAAEMQPQIDALVAEVEALKVAVETGKVEAVQAFKADLKAKYEEQQVAEMAGETGFGALLA